MNEFLLLCGDKFHHTPSSLLSVLCKSIPFLSAKPTSCIRFLTVLQLLDLLLSSKYLLLAQFPLLPKNNLVVVRQKPWFLCSLMQIASRLRNLHKTINRIIQEFARNKEQVRIYGPWLPEYYHWKNLILHSQHSGYTHHYYWLFCSSYRFGVSFTGWFQRYLQSLLQGYPESFFQVTDLKKQLNRRKDWYIKSIYFGFFDFTITCSLQPFSVNCRIEVGKASKY